MKKGFTIVELLAVVLIIGVLTAIAMPQYKKVGAQGRLASLKPMLDSLKSAEETYHYATGKYAYDIDLLDVKQGCTPFTFEGAADNSVIKCGQGFLVDIIAGNPSSGSGETANNITAFYCPNEIRKGDEINCVNKADFKYIVWLNHSDYPGKTECKPLNGSEFGSAVCEVETGE